MAAQPLSAYYPSDCALQEVARAAARLLSPTAVAGADPSGDARRHVSDDAALPPLLMLLVHSLRGERLSSHTFNDQAAISQYHDCIHAYLIALRGSAFDLVQLHDRLRGLGCPDGAIQALHYHAQVYSPPLRDVAPARAAIHATLERFVAEAPLPSLDEIDGLMRDLKLYLDTYLQRRDTPR